MIGTTVAQYKILEKLGEGGMGVVYKAEDVKLKRTVALKFLPHHVSATEEERARFLQEAQAIATLNHPNVCTIFGIEEHEGQQFLEMEYVDGETLRGKITGSGLPLGEAIDYAIQIGEALQEAHTKGIVHRDVKAENIMVNSRDQAKVMDFGLAKLKGALKLTRTSSTIGTLAYMAPEQLRGEEIDARSDLFSFGVVLYEMVTGRTPFRGEHDAAMMYSILNEEPEPLQNHKPDLPGDLIHILNNALEKDAEDRYQSAAEMVRELRRLKKHSGRVSRKHIPVAPSGEGAPVTRESPSPEAAKPPEKQRKGVPVWAKVAAGVIVFAVVVFGVWKLVTTSPGISQNMTFKPLSIPFRTIWYPALSDDGNWIAFPVTDENNVSEIYYMNAAGGEPKKLTNDSLFKYTADISPDGSQILYSRGNSRQVAFTNQSLWTVSTLGGVPTRVSDQGMGGQWSPDGRMIAYLGQSTTRGPSLWVMNLDGSGKRMVLEDSVGGPGSRISLSWSPEGGALAWLRNWKGPEGTYQEIILRDLKTGEERQLTSERKNIDEVCWTAGGFLLYSTNLGGASNLWAVHEDGGEPVQITKGPGPDLAVRASRDGRRILYMQQVELGSIAIGDQHGLNAMEITAADRAVRSPKFSPDGEIIAYVGDDPDPIKPASSIYLIDRDGRNRRQLVRSKDYIGYPSWSPDGRKVAYPYRDSIWKSTVVDVRDPNKRRDLGPGFVSGWLDRGKAVNLALAGASWRVPLDGGAREKISENSTRVILSPYGGGEVMRDQRGDTIRWLVRKQGGTFHQFHEGRLRWGFLWHPDGRSMVFATSGNMMQISLETGSVQSYPWKNPEAVYFNHFSPDGKRTLFVKNRPQSKLILIDDFM
jgi:serine/threonine protein kinase